MRDVDRLRLRPIRLDDEAACLAAHDALLADDFTFLHDHVTGEPWADYVRRQEERRHGIDVPVDRVPSALLVADVDGEVVGRSSIRFRFNDYLETCGGHIGYGVTPGQRRRGYATEMLRQSLVVIRANGIGRVLVTCAVGNVGSAAVIEACGGEFESLVDDPREGVVKRRYWID